MRRRGTSRGLQRLGRAFAGLLLKPVWLPPSVYAAVPWVYLGSGSAALVGGLYLPDDSWYLPYLALAGIGLLRAAAAIAAMRRRVLARRRQGVTA